MGFFFRLDVSKDFSSNAVSAKAANKRFHIKKAVSHELASTFLARFVPGIHFSVRLGGQLPD
jgi:hypothetical protein